MWGSLCSYNGKLTAMYTLMSRHAGQTGSRDPHTAGGESSLPYRTVQFGATGDTRQTTARHTAGLGNDVMTSNNLVTNRHHQPKFSPCFRIFNSFFFSLLILKMIEVQHEPRSHEDFNSLLVAYFSIQIQIHLSRWVESGFIQILCDRK